MDRVTSTQDEKTMSNARTTIAHIAADAREFHDTAVGDGFDASDALSLLGEIADDAEKRIAGIPANAPIAVFAVLAQDTVCEDVLDIVENCFDHIVRDRACALAVRAKLQAAVDGLGSMPDSAEAEFRDRALDRIDLIDAVHPGGE